MNVVQGDLIVMALDNMFDVIIHGCNCHCVMGAGVARSIKKEFPEAYEEDRRTIKGDRNKLGTISHVTVNREGNEITIVNAYTQYYYGSESGVDVDYRALRYCMKLIKNKFKGKRIGYPLIGAGLAGGDWNIISKIIDEELIGENHTLVEYVQQG